MVRKKTRHHDTIDIGPISAAQADALIAAIAAPFKPRRHT